jgi:hypothetical protein
MFNLQISLKFPSVRVGKWRCRYGDSRTVLGTEVKYENLSRSTTSQDFGNGGGCYAY